jgi:hypothetical protein
MHAKAVLSLSSIDKRGCDGMSRFAICLTPQSQHSQISSCHKREAGLQET